jgi:carboxyl-terminal processing protease
LYVEPLPADLLDVAAEAARGEIARSGPSSAVPDPPKSIDEAGGASAFIMYYCQLWQVAGDATDASAVAYASLRAMAAALNDAHTEFITPQAYQAQQAALSGDERYEGIGVRLSATPLTIDYVFPESPAQDAGLREGDQIVRIDGQATAGLGAPDAVPLVRGAAGTTVTLGIRRPGVAEELTVRVARGTIRVPTLVSSVVEDVGHLRLTSFPHTRLDEEVAAELDWFNAVGVRALILDLRGNPGGGLEVGTRIAGLFLQPGAPIYRETSPEGRETVRASSNGPRWSKPLVVLIDQGTASMGELLAAALNEQVGATLIGSNTAGAVAGSVSVPLSDGSAMQITTMRIDSSLGAMLNVDGLQPDVRVPRPEPATRGATDPALDAALTYLRTQAPRAGAGLGPREGNRALVGS